MKFLFKLFFTTTFIFLIIISCILGQDLYKLIRNDYTSSNVFFISPKKNSINSGGTGFVINYKGKQYTVTNWHACRGHINNVMYNREEELKILDFDVINDLCVLSPSKNKNGLYLSFGEGLKHQEIHFIGFPNVDNKSVRYGNIVSKKTSVMIFFEIKSDFDLISCMIESGSPGFNSEGTFCYKSFDYIDTTSAGGPGSSGSPVMDSFGMVLGVMQNSSNISINSGFIEKKHLETLLEKVYNERRND